LISKTALQKELDRAAKRLWELQGNESEIWKERGRILSEKVQQLDGDKNRLGEWCQENDYWGLNRNTLFKQRSAYELLEESDAAHVQHLPDDYGTISKIKPKWEKIKKMLANGKGDVLLDERGKITRTTLAKAFPRPPKLPAKRGVAKECWTPADFRVLRQRCHPDKHPGDEEKWAKVWHLIEIAYKG